MRYMSEEQALQLWCPFARSYDLLDCEGGGEKYRPVTVNRKRGGNPDDDCFCIASGCMAWRWEPDAGITEDAPRGFCGLVGSVNT